MASGTKIIPFMGIVNNKRIDSCRVTAITKQAGQAVDCVKLKNPSFAQNVTEVYRGYIIYLMTPLPSDLELISRLSSSVVSSPRLSTYITAAAAGVGSWYWSGPLQIIRQIKRQLWRHNFKRRTFRVPQLSLAGCIASLEALTAAQRTQSTSTLE